MKAPIVTALLASLASGRAIYSPRDLRVARHEGNLVTSTLAADPTAITEPAGPNDSFDANSNGDAHNNQAPTGQQSCNAQLDQCTEQVDTAANNVSVEQCQQQQELDACTNQQVQDAPTAVQDMGDGGSNAEEIATATVGMDSDQNATLQPTATTRAVNDDANGQVATTQTIAMDTGIDSQLSATVTAVTAETVSGQSTATETIQIGGNATNNNALAATETGAPASLSTGNAIMGNSAAGNASLAAAPQPPALVPGSDGSDNAGDQNTEDDGTNGIASGIIGAIDDVINIGRRFVS